MTGHAIWRPEAFLQVRRRLGSRWKHHKLQRTNLRLRKGFTDLGSNSPEHERHEKERFTEADWPRVRRDPKNGNGRARAQLGVHLSKKGVAGKISKLYRVLTWLKPAKSRGFVTSFGVPVGYGAGEEERQERKEDADQWARSVSERKRTGPVGSETGRGKEQGARRILLGRPALGQGEAREAGLAESHQVSLLFFFLIHFPQPFLNKILNANNFKTKAISIK